LEAFIYQMNPNVDIAAISESLIQTSLSDVAAAGVP